MPPSYRERTKTKTATIASGQSLSAEVDVEDYAIYAIEMPTAWTAANLTFQAASASGGTFRDLYGDAGSEVAVVVAADQMIGLDASGPELVGARFLKIRSGTSAAPVNQTAERTLTLLLWA